MLITVGVINISVQLLAKIEDFTMRGGRVLANTRFADSTSVAANGKRILPIGSALARRDDIKPIASG